MTVLFENRDAVVCIKPAGVESETEMPGLLRAYWGQENAPVFCVHRLDTATGGVMVYARTKAAAAFFSKQITEGAFKKQYLCVCAGKPEPAAGEMHDFLFKDSRKNKVFPVKSARKGAKEALLEYQVLGSVSPEMAAEAAGGFSLCRVLLHTGRTHQIRVQFASRKHPLFGDGKYGSREKGPLGLWCESLCLALPGESEARTFSAPPPDSVPWQMFFKK
jgi:23S rRNA pseudouridine1911/1915/1917 synthase